MPRTQRSIRPFAAVSKPTIDGVNGSKKRKSAVLEDGFPELELKAAELKKRKVQEGTPPDSPTKASRRAFANLVLTTPTPSLKSTKRKRSMPTPSPSIDTPPSSLMPLSVVKRWQEETTIQLPAELHELVQLNSALLAALSLHYAHNGMTSPVQIRTLTPSITKLWGIRKVLLADVRICLGVLQNSACPSKNGKSHIFTIVNYGDGKICLELKGPRRKAGRELVQPFNEQRLNDLFKERLENQWVDWRTTKGTPLWNDFYDQLPVAEVHMRASAYINPSLAKGQQRLEEVLGINGDNDKPTQRHSNKKQRISRISDPAECGSGERTIKPPVPPLSKPSGKENEKPDMKAITANIRGLSLLERIRAKDTLTSNSPTPTKAELERHAALHRSEEMLGILDMLAIGKGGQRASFPLPALVRSVQSSFRSPISKDEIECCLAVLEKEVAPGYVKVSRFGSVVGVVVNRMGKPVAEELRSRLKALGVN